MANDINMNSPKEAARLSRPSVKLNELIIKIITLIEKITENRYGSSYKPKTP